MVFSVCGGSKLERAFGGGQWYLMMANDGVGFEIVTVCQWWLLVGNGG